MRRKPETAPVAACEGSNESALRERIRFDLEARGLGPSDAEVLAAAVARELPDDGECHAAMLDGVVLGFRLQATLVDEQARGAGELQEIERLMGSFAGELSKLDEVLEVLAAYLRRMRTASPPAPSRIVH